MSVRLKYYNRSTMLDTIKACNNGTDTCCAYTNIQCEVKYLLMDSEVRRPDCGCMLSSAKD